MNSNGKHAKSQQSGINGNLTANSDTTNVLTYRALEPRIAFDAAAVATVDQAVADADAADANAPAADGTSALPAPAEPLSASQLQDLAASITAASNSDGNPPSVIVFIDSRVSDPGVIAAAVPEGAEVILLDGSRDGMAQIASALAGRSGIDAIHIVSHGEAGELHLGAGELTTTSISAQHADEMATIRSALSEQADILLYGCEVSAGSEGEAFIAALASATGADVAASIDDTGTASLGGNWDLETRTGLIEAGLIDAPEWNGLMAPLTISTTALPTVTGSTGMLGNLGGGFFTASGGANLTAVWINAGTIGSTTIDIRATVTSTTASSISFYTIGDDPSVILNGTGTATVEWEIFAADATHSLTVAAIGSPNFQVADIDGVGGVPNTRETVRPHLSGLTAYTVDTTTNLVATVSAGGVQVSGTQNQNNEPTSLTRFTWQDVSTWSVDYIFAPGSGFSNAISRHDGDGDFTFVAPNTVYLLSLDLDANNSTSGVSATDKTYQATYVENSSGIAVVDADATISQNGVLGTTLGSATVRLVNANPGDLLDVGTLPVGITATVDTNIAGVITVSLSGTASVADYQTALKAVTFSNSTESPSTADRQIEVSVRNTTFGTSSNIALSTIHVTSVNDAPAGTDAVVTTDEDASHTFTTADFGYSDPGEGHALQSVTIDTLPAAGTLELNGNPILPGTVIAASDIGDLVYTPPLNANGSGFASFTFTVTDAGGTANGGADTDPSPNTITFDVTSVNNVPVAVSDRGSAPAGSAVTIAVLGNDTDPDNAIDPASVEITGSTGPGASLAVTGEGTWAVNTSTGAITFTPEPGFIGAPTSITYTVADTAGERSIPATVAVMPILTPPHLDLGAETIYTAPASGAGAFLFGHQQVSAANRSEASYAVLPANVTQVVGNEVAGAGISVSYGGGTHADVTGAGATSLDLAIAANDYISMSFTTTTGMPESWITHVTKLNAGGPNYQFAIAISTDGFQTFTLLSKDNASPSSGSPTNYAPNYPNFDGTDFMLQAGTTYEVRAYVYNVVGGAAATLKWDDFYVFFANDPAGIDRTFTEGGPGVSIMAAGAEIEDSASASMASGTVELTNKQASDRFIIGGTPVANGDTGTIGGITYTVTETAGSISIALNGTASKADYTAFLGQVAFENASEAPDTTDRVINVTVSDGIETSNTATAIVHVVPVNDAPAGVDRTVGTNEDTDYIFSAAEFGFTDPLDAPDNALASVIITTLPGAGTLLLNGNPVAAGDVITAADLTKLSWTPPINATGTGLASFTFQVVDDGGTANGGVDTDPSANTITFDVAAVNDAPAGVDRTVGTNEDTPYVFSAAEFGFTDPNDAPANALASVILTTLPGSGTMLLDGNPVAAGDVIAVADLTKLTWTPPSNANGAGLASFTFEIVDDGGTASGGADTDASANTITFNVASINDAPAGTNATLTVQEDGSHTFTAADFGFTDPNDSPAHDFLEVIITTLPGTGTLELGGMPVTVGQVIPVADIGSLVWTPPANVNGTGIAAFDFQVVDNGAPDANLVVNGSLEDTAFTAPNTYIPGYFSTTPPPAADINPIGLEGWSRVVTLLPSGGPEPYYMLQSTALVRDDDAATTDTPYGDQFGYFANVYQTISGLTPGETYVISGDAIVDALNPFSTANFQLDVYEGAAFNGTIDNTGGTNPAVIATGRLNSAIDGSDPAWRNLTYTVVVPASGSISLVVIKQSIGAAFCNWDNISVTPAATANTDLAPNTITFDVSPVNDAPAGVDRTVGTNEDTPYVFSQAEFGFSDPLDDPDNVFASIILTTLPGTGAMLLDGNPVAAGAVISVADLTKLTWTPPSNANGAGLASFTFQVTDDGSTANGGVTTDASANTITFDVTSVNDAPAGVDRTVGTNEDTSYVFSPAEFGFSDPIDEPDNVFASVILTTLPGSGTMLLDGNAVTAGDVIAVGDLTKLTWTPPSNANGAGLASFTYQVVDNDGTANGGADTDASPNVISFDVAPINDTPVVIDPATPGTALNPIQAGDPLSIIPDVTRNDGQAMTPIDVSSYLRDPDGDTLTYELDPSTTPSWLSIDPSSGVITGTPPADASQASNTGNPGVYLIVIAARDPHGALATTTVTMTVGNPAPIALADSASAFEGGPAIAGNAIADLVTGDTDTGPDSDALVIAAVNGDPALVGQPVAGSTGGTFTLNPDGSWSFDPGQDFQNLAEGQTRDTVITYRVADGQGGTAEATVTVSVSGANDAPVALGPIPRQTSVESAPIAPIVTAPAFENPNDLTLAFSATNLPDGLSIDPTTGVISGTPSIDASEQSAYVVMVTAIGPNGETATIPVVIAVTNPAPIAVDDTATTAPDTPVVLAPLANDSDPDGDVTTVTAVEPAANGTVTLNPDGTITYVPNTGYIGSETLTYTATDAQGATSTATITITVGAPPADAPVVTGSLPTQTGTDALPITPINAGALFADPNGGSLAFSATGLPPGLVIDPATGIITGTLDPDAAVAGAYAITVTGVDPDGNQVSMQFVLGVTNPAPIAANDAASTAANIPVVIGVLGNDTDPDGDALSVSHVSDPANGSVTINPDGTLTYSPNAGFNGTDTFTYTVSDGQGGTEIATVTVSVGVPNANSPVVMGTLAPAAGIDGLPISPIDIGALISDPNGDPLSFAATGLPPGLTIDPVTGVISGTLQPDSSSAGPFVITVIAADPSGNQVTTTIVLSGINPIPAANDDIAGTAVEQPVVIDVLANDVDPDGDPLAVTATTAPTNGSIVINPNGTITYMPEAGFTGTDTFTYTITDADGSTKTAYVTVNVGTPSPLAAVPAIAPTVGTDGTTITPVIVGPAFRDPDALDAVTLSVNETALPPGITFNAATGTFSGTAEKNASQGSTPGEPAGTYIVPVTAEDENGAVVTTYVTFTFSNLAPVAVADTGGIGEDTTLISGNVITDALTGDADTAPDSDPLTVVSASQGANQITIGLWFTVAGGGQVKLDADGTYEFKPGNAYNGLDVDETAVETITYTVSDGNGATSTATLTITVSGANDTPVVIDPDNPGTATNPIPAGDPLNIIPDVSTSDGAPLTPINVADFVRDPDGEPLTYTLDPATTPAWLSIDPDSGVITGTPPKGASQATNTGTPGEYLITITATDPDGATVTTTVTFTIANVEPVAVDDTAKSERWLPITIEVLANDTDGAPDKDPLEVIEASADIGTVKINPDGTITYTPKFGFEGEDVITYRISDGNGGFATATVVVKVTGDPVVVAPANFGAAPVAMLGLDLPGSLTADGMVVDTIEKMRQRDVADNAFDRLRSFELYDVAGISSFSLKVDSGLKEGVTIETFVSKQTLTISLQLSNKLAGAEVAEWKVQRADGRPMPDWLSFTGDDIIAGDRPADVERIDLRVTAILLDGRTVSYDVRIQATTGEIQPLRIGPRSDAPQPFWQKIRHQAMLDETDIRGLARHLEAAE